MLSTRALVSAGSGPRVARRTPDDWPDRPYERFTLRPLSPTIGAEVDGVRLASALDGELRAELHRALLEWKVLFFRDQVLDADQHAAFAHQWGALEVNPLARVGATAPLPGFAQSDGQPDRPPEHRRLRERVAQRHHMARHAIDGIGAAGRAGPGGRG